MREVGRKTLGPSLRLGLAETIWSEVIWALPPQMWQQAQQGQQGQQQQGQSGSFLVSHKSMQLGATRLREEKFRRIICCEIHKEVQNSAITQENPQAPHAVPKRRKLDFGFHH